MLKQSWQESLRELILRSRNEDTRIALIGIGHELRGDDGVGIAIVRALAATHPGNDRLCLLEVQHAPENFTSVLRRFKPNVVLMIDSANLGEAPGNIRWLSWKDLGGMTSSTHSLSLSLLANYLRLQLQCDIELLGIQPDCDTIGTALSASVRQAADSITAIFMRELC